MSVPASRSARGGRSRLPGVVAEDPWRLHAACRSEPAATFFPEGQRRFPGVMDAQAVCQGCQVRAECLAYARANGEQWGVWGGVDFEEPWRARQQEKARRLKERARLLREKRRQESGEAA